MDFTDCCAKLTRRNLGCASVYLPSFSSTLHWSCTRWFPPKTPLQCKLERRTSTLASLLVSIALKLHSVTPPLTLLQSWLVGRTSAPRLRLGALASLLVNIALELQLQLKATSSKAIRPSVLFNPSLSDTDMVTACCTQKTHSPENIDTDLFPWLAR